MSPTDDTTTRRVGADGETVETPTEPTNEVVEAEVPGADKSKFVTLTLAHPLNKQDRLFLGLPEDASTEVHQQVRVSKNGAKTLINAGLVQVDPEDATAVRSALRGESGDEAEPTTEPDADAPVSPLANPPQAKSTPGGNGPAPQASAPDAAKAGGSDGASSTK